MHGRQEELINIAEGINEWLCKTLILHKLDREIGMLNKNSKCQWYYQNWQIDATIKIQECRFF